VEILVGSVIALVAIVPLVILVGRSLPVAHVASRAATVHSCAPAA
jgi:hypothetical protein